MTCISCSPSSKADSVGGLDSVTCCASCLDQAAHRIPVHTKEVIRLNAMIQKTTEKWWVTYDSFPDALCDRFSDMQCAWTFAKNPKTQSSAKVVSTQLVCGAFIKADVADKIERTVQRDPGIAKIWKFFCEYTLAKNQFQNSISRHTLAIAILTREVERKTPHEAKTNS